MAGEERQSEEATGSASTGGTIRALAEFFLLMLRKNESPATNPFEEADPTREKIVARMARDVERTLWSDVTLGGLAINIAADTLIIERSMAVEGPWAVAEARFEVDYDYLALTP